MYCRASATLVDHIGFANHGHGATLPKSNWAANLPSRGGGGWRFPYNCEAIVWIAHAAARVLDCARSPAAAGLRRRPAVPLHECRLEHPLQLTSMAARCGILQVPEDRAHPERAPASTCTWRWCRRSTGAARRRRCFCWPAARARRRGDVRGATPAPSRASTAITTSCWWISAAPAGPAPLSCDYPEDWQEPRRLLPALRKATAPASHKLGDRVRFYTTSIAGARSRRGARGAGLSGRSICTAVSYGTRVAELYMRRYPGHVHAVILDGVTYPEQAIGPDTPLDGERALDLIVARCVQTPDCAAAYPELAATSSTALRTQFGPQKVAVDHRRSEQRPAAAARVQPQHAERRAALALLQRRRRLRCCPR